MRLKVQLACRRYLIRSICVPISRGVRILYGAIPPVMLYFILFVLNYNITKRIVSFQLGTLSERELFIVKKNDGFRVGLGSYFEIGDPKDVEV